MIHSFISAPLAVLLEAAARSLLMAAAVGAGLALLRARNVVAQKSAWVLVLAGATLMPMLAAWNLNFAWLPRLTWLPQITKLTMPTSVRSAIKDQPSASNAAPIAIANRSTQIAVEPVVRQHQPLINEPANTMNSDPPASDEDRSPAPMLSQISTDQTGSANRSSSMTPLSKSVNWLWFALMVYLAVCAALFSRLLYGLAAAVRLWRNAEPVSLGQIRTTQFPIRSSNRLASPVTIASAIVLPANYSDWDAEKLRIVLAHEASHVRQRDFYLQLAAGLYAAIFWFSPLGWWLKRKLSDLSETISDRAAVGEAASHASYAQVLLEFAAMPRPLPIGVAMARKGRLIPRIERLLNESSFRQAFAGGRFRIAAAVLLVPVALFAAMARIHVQAAAQEPTPPPAQASDSAATPQAPAAPRAQAPAIAPPPTAPAEPDDAVTPPMPDRAPQTGVMVSPNMILLGPGHSLQIDNAARVQALLAANGNLSRVRSMALLKAYQADSFSKGLHAANFAFGGDGNAYALVSGEGDKNISFSGNWFEGSHEEIEKARKVAHGDFLWFERDGKSYVIDDPSIVAGLKALQAPIDALGKKQEELGKQQEALGKQQEDLGKLQEQASVPTPDMTKELAKLDEAISKLNALKGGKVTQDQLSEIESRLGDLQGKIGGIEGQIGEKQGELGEKQGKLGEQQGKLGEEQGRLGAEEGRLAREMDGKILSTIDEALKNGKAKLVQ